MKNNLQISNKLSTIVFYLAILIFIIGFSFTDTPQPSNWYQQFMPIPFGGQLKDLTFVDSVLGFAVSDSSILKTTNGGDNWTVKQNGYYLFQRIQFLNRDTGFACGGNNKLLKTTNAGENWLIITPSTIYPFDMSVLNTDTIWLADAGGLTGGVFRTTNGGAGWTQQYYVFNQNPAHIYMYNRNIGFMDASGLYKTTNSGLNWFSVSGGGYLQMFFIDSLTGWKCNFDMKKTTDGGLNWITQTLPSGGNIVLSYMKSFSNINMDTIWGAGGVVTTGSGNRGMLFRTTNQGNNWFYQVPDSININIFQYYHINFINKNNGWSYSITSGIHTTAGGDTNFLTGIQEISSVIPKNYKLYQNYPNPFNPRTIINYEIRKTGFVKLSVYDITGKHIIDLVNQQQNAGTYQVDFSGNGYSSGVYFYRIVIHSDKLVIGDRKEEYTETKKMVLIK